MNKDNLDDIDIKIDVKDSKELLQKIIKVWHEDIRIINIAELEFHKYLLTIQEEDREERIKEHIHRLQENLKQLKVQQVASGDYDN